MATVPTLPRRPWTERLSLAFAAGLTLIGVCSIAGWGLGIDFLIAPFDTLAPIRINEGVCFALLGVILFARELKWQAADWLAAAPLLVGILTLAECLFGWDLRIDELFSHDRLLVDTAFAGRPSLTSACCLILGSGVLLSSLLPARLAVRNFTEAVVGSVLASAGAFTLLGYAFSLKIVYMWGTGTATSPVAAAAFLIFGIALLFLAWRAKEKEGESPIWLWVPSSIACVTLSLIFWIGLRERELAYLGSKTTAAADQVATMINSEIESQTTSLDRIARNWAVAAEDNPTTWEADAATQLGLARDLGCVSIGSIGSNLRTQWVYPRQGNEASLNFDNASVPARRDSIVASQERGVSAVSPTTEIGVTKDPGFVIYVPVLSPGKPIRFIAAEYVYQRLLNSIVRTLKLSGDYAVAASIGGVPIFRSSSSNQPHNGNYELIKDYTIFDRTIQLTMTPTDFAIDRDRRLFPELALLAGFGISLLLGLSVELARRARSGQRMAEQSNMRLVAENEERRRIEARLKVSDERLRLALDSTQIGIFEWNVPRGHVYYSPGLWSLLGYEHNRMPSTLEAWQSLVHPDDRSLYRRKTESQLNGIATFIDPEYRVRNREGDWRWVYVRSKSVATAPNGRPTRIIGTVQDITSRRESEQALRESQAQARKLSLVASKTDNIVIIGSPDGRIEWVNAAFCRVMEYALDEVVGRDPAHLLAGPETDPAVVEHMREGIARGHGVSAEIVHYSKSGRKYYLQLEVQVVRNQAGQVENFIAMETDITARVETENHLRRAKAEADAASRAKSEFLASMSHEIRTPMNGVIGMTSLLMETPLTNEQRDFVNTIRTSGEALLTIINDILDFSKIESGKMELEQAPFELALCVEEALDLFAPQAAAKNVEIGCHIGSDVPAWIVGDVTRLRQVIVNLVNNAIKFTPSGSVSVEVRRFAPEAVRLSSSQKTRLEIVVSDTGIGIPPDRIDRLFKAFSQVDSSTTRKYGGTGLGLAICQRLCQLMGGDIRADSVPGKGSNFTVNIVVEAATRPAEVTAAPFPAIPLRGKLVLCIEDHPVTRLRLSSLLESLGATCAFASELESAMQMAQALPSPAAMVVLDWVEKDGASSLEKLANFKCPRLILFPFGAPAPVTPEDGFPCAAIPKPIKTSTFFHALATMSSSTNRSATSTERRDDRLLSEEIPLDILLAEDNPVNQKVAKRFLERMGYTADSVGNGLEAISALESRRYDLVLMDLQMPEMDGLEASREIRRRLSADRQPKIIALTANAMQGDREVCLGAGMDDYISKPVKMPEIAAAIRRQFGKRPVSA